MTAAITDKTMGTFQIPGPIGVQSKETDKKESESKASMEVNAERVQMASIHIISDVNHVKYSSVHQMLYKEKLKGGKVALFMENYREKREFLIYSLDPDEKSEPLTYHPFVRIAVRYGIIMGQTMEPYRKLCDYRGIIGTVEDLLVYPSFRVILKDRAKLKEIISSYSPISLGLNKNIQPHKPDKNSFEGFISELSTLFYMTDHCMNDESCSEHEKELLFDGGIAHVKDLVLKNRENLFNFLYIVECLVMTIGLKVEKAKTQFKKIESYDFPISDLLKTFYLYDLTKLGGEEGLKALAFSDILNRNLRSQMMLRKVITTIKASKDKFSKVVICLGLLHQEIIEKGLAAYSKTPVKVTRIDTVDWTPRYYSELLA